jgi:hypothetical protein
MCVSERGRERERTIGLDTYTDTILKETKRNETKQNERKKS